MAEKKSKKTEENKDKKSKGVKENQKKEKISKSEEKKREEVIETVEGNIEKAEEKEEKKEDAHPDKKQIFEENKILIIFGGILLLLLAAFISYLAFSNNAKSFTYGNVTYSIANYGNNHIFYKTTIPVVINGSRINYNAYLYNNPKDLAKEVPFKGDLYVRPIMNLNYSNDINCKGDGVVALAELENLYTAMGTKLVYDPNATCDPQQRYVEINIKTSNETNIQEIAPACYTINVANCQIIPALERYMTETFTTIKPYLSG